MEILGTSDAGQLDPLQYPWDPPPTSGVINGNDFLPLQLAAGRPLARSRLRDRAEDSLTSCCLDKALDEAGAAPLDSRVLVVSIGSNSSPDVLRSKFAKYRQPVSRILPLIRGKLHNIGVGHSAHVSKAGYIAAAPYFRMGERTTVWVSWLDWRQLMALDETEPNYRRIQLDGDACPLVVDNGECPEAFSLFTSRWGVLTDGNGEKLPFLDQPALFRLLAGSGSRDGLKDAHSVFEGPPERVLEQLRMPAVQAWAKEWFRAAGFAAQVPFDGLTKI
ncbi:hypothetical protein [Pseudarthrobacter sp. H2]|uniref:hypothetical protein n=1 Tax=Pseudarthrobacter sp. H2 TaxID=3418415 RepID=UPI003CF30C35